MVFVESAYLVNIPLSLWFVFQRTVKGKFFRVGKRIKLVDSAFLVDLRLTLWFAFYRTV
jgi:hypothetical protein